jgi:hypothetical protein
MFYKLASAVLALALISFLVLATTISYAETVTVTGADGAPGMPGSDAVAIAGPGPGPDPTNTANATGGTGGSSGAGGNATATATTSVPTGAASAFSNAVGDGRYGPGRRHL